MLVRVSNYYPSLTGASLAAKPHDVSSIVTRSWPTDSMGWVVAYCARRIQEGLVKSFAEAGYRVSPEQYSILAQLWEKDGLSQQTLADRFHRSKVAAFHLITKLEKQGAVVRKPNPADGRSNLVYLTAEGRATVATLIPLAQRNLDRALGAIPSEDVDAAREVLYVMAANLAS